METKKKGILVTKAFARKQFSTIGLVLIVYAFFVLFIPAVLEMLLILKDSNIVKDTTLYIGFFYLFMVLGTFIPFFILKKAMRVKTKNFFGSAYISTKKLFINFLVFFTLVSLTIFISTSLFNNIQLEGQAVSSIGLQLEEKYLNNWLYIVTYVIATPIIEEYAFRGVLLSSLSKYGKYFAVVTTSIIYALAHGSFTEMLPALVISCLLSKLTLKYKSVKPAMIIHILFNATFYLMMILPDNYNLYVLVGLVVIYILSFIFITKKIYIPIKIKKSRNLGKTFGIFFSSVSVIIACTCFIFSSIIMLLI